MSVVLLSIKADGATWSSCGAESGVFVCHSLAVDLLSIMADGATWSSCGAQTGVFVCCVASHWIVGRFNAVVKSSGYCCILLI